METILSRLRIDAGLTRAEASRQLGVDQSALWRWESGKREPPASQVRALATLYRVSADVILDALERQREEDTVDSEV
jgi:transcriptional regulator with XRE-family HTH domain